MECQQIQIILPAGKTTYDLNEAAEEYLKYYFPQWKQNQVVIMPRFFMSPFTELFDHQSGVDVKKEGHFKGLEAEARIRGIIENQLRELKEPCAIFSGIELKKLGRGKSTLTNIAVIEKFLNKKVNYDFNNLTQIELSDILVISERRGILLIEVKSKNLEQPQGKHSRVIHDAIIQSERGIAILKEILSAGAITTPESKISQVIAIPNSNDIQPVGKFKIITKQWLEEASDGRNLIPELFNSCKEALNRFTKEEYIRIVKLFMILKASLINNATNLSLRVEKKEICYLELMKQHIIRI